jgi:hypothetical protein
MTPVDRPAQKTFGPLCVVEKKDAIRIAIPVM